MSNNKTYGFTLIELLVTIAIIGLLATIVFVALQGARQKARDARRLTDVQELAKALEFYYDATGHYPLSATTTECAVPGKGNWIPDGTNYDWSDSYINVQPRDPAENCGSDAQQAYSYQSDGTHYRIGMQLEGTTDPDTHEGQQVTFDGTSFQKNLTQFTIAFSSSAGTVTNLSPIPVTVTFSAPASDFNSGSLSTENVSLISSFVQLLETVYSFLVTPQSNGTVTVGVAGGAVHSAGGAANAPAQISVTYDSERPHVSLSPDPLPGTVSGPFSVSVNFTLPVVDFSAADISLVNGSVSQFMGGSQNYTFTVTPQGSGAVQVSIPDGVAHTEAGNANVASNVLNTSF